MRLALLLAVPLLISGCLDGGLPEDGNGPGTTPAPGEAPRENFQEVTIEDLHLSGYVEECDAGHCLSAMASNEGSSDYHVSNICVSPFSESMSRDGETVHRQEPMAYCQAFGTTPMGPNTHLDYEAEWDGTLWTESEGTQDAPEGEYTWQITFRAYESADGGNPIDLVLQFPV